MKIVSSVQKNKSVHIAVTSKALMKKVISLLAAVMILVSAEIKATAVIALIYPDKIILSVDSRFTDIDNVSGKKRYRTNCKIHIFNNVAFAFSGFVGSSGEVSKKLENFNTALFIKSYLSRSYKPVFENFQDLKQGLSTELTKQFRVLKKFSPKEYNYFLKTGMVMNLILVGNNNRQPFPLL